MLLTLVGSIFADNLTVSSVELKAGESKTIDIDFPRERFEGWDVKTNTMRVVPGKYSLMVGSSSADKDLKAIDVDIQ